jgi:hypothetical protein
MNAKTPRRQEEKRGMNAETPRRGGEKNSMQEGADALPPSPVFDSSFPLSSLPLRLGVSAFNPLDVRRMLGH